MDCESGEWSPCGKTNGELECPVEGLQTGEKYKFRVRAKNSEGESEPLVGPYDSVLIKDPFDPPGPPGLPEITDWTESTVNLKWEKPLRENGAPVTHYTMEYRYCILDAFQNVYSGLTLVIFGITKSGFM